MVGGTWNNVAQFLIASFSVVSIGMLALTDPIYYIPVEAASHIPDFLHPATTTTTSAIIETYKVIIAIVINMYA